MSDIHDSQIKTEMLTVSAEASPDEITRFIPTMISAVGWQRWKRRIDALEAQRKRLTNPIFFALFRCDRVAPVNILE